MHVQIAGENLFVKKHTHEKVFYLDNNECDINYCL